MQKLERTGGEFLYAKNFYGNQEADLLFDRLRESLAWRKSPACLTAQYERPGKSSAGGESIPFTATLTLIKEDMERALRHRYHAVSVLASLLRKGGYWGRHTGDGAGLGDDSMIALLSFGEEYRILLADRREFLLSHGAILAMMAPTWRNCSYSVSVPQEQTKAHINLAFWMEST